MAVNPTALSDLRFGLGFAADRYRHYGHLEVADDNAALFFSLADERADDAQRLREAVNIAGLAPAAPTMDAQTIGPLLGFGNEDPWSPASAAFRVQRAENRLGRMAGQLRSLANQQVVRDALEDVSRGIEQRRPDVRNARRLARSFRRGVGQSGISIVASAQGEQVVVWYGTDRRRDRNGTFVGEWADSTSFGRCRVFVPQDRAMGSLGRGPLGRLVRGDNRVKVESNEQLSEAAFWSTLARDVAALDMSQRQGLVFLHGYCTKFDDAARRTAQLKVDLGHMGPAAFFSWPSLGSKLGYPGDESAIEGSEQAIRSFLIDFAQRSGASKVHIIAHSMGNRALLRALDAIARAAATTAPISFGQIFIAAPDVDSRVFKNLAAAYAQLADRATLYVTKNDQVMGLSARLHRFPRAGLTPPVVIVPGVDTIDASRVNLDMSGHGYVHESRPVLADIHELIQNGTPPDQRFGLRKPSAGALHWEFAA